MIVQCSTDTLARPGEALSLFLWNFVCNLFRRLGRIGKRAVKLVVFVETRYWQTEDILVEMPRAPLALRLIAFHANAQGLAVKNAAEIAGLFEALRCRPIKVMLNNRSLILNDACGWIYSRCGIHDAYRRYGELAGQLPVIIALLKKAQCARPVPFPKSLRLFEPPGQPRITTGCSLCRVQQFEPLGIPRNDGPLRL